MYGHSHSPYTEKGVRSIEWVADELASLDVQTVYSSPLERTKTLADAIAARHELEVVTDERIQEMGVGIFEQMTIPEAEKAYPEHLRPFLDNFGFYKAPGSELFSEVQARVASFLQELVPRYENHGKEELPERPIVVVSHAMAIRGAFAHLFNAELPDLRHIRIHPAAILEVSYQNGRAILEGLRDPHNLLD